MVTRSDRRGEKREGYADSNEAQRAVPGSYRCGLARGATSVVRSAKTSRLPNLSRGQEDERTRTSGCLSRSPQRYLAMPSRRSAAHPGFHRGTTTGTQELSTPEWSRAPRKPAAASLRINKRTTTPHAGKDRVPPVPNPPQQVLSTWAILSSSRAARPQTSPYGASPAARGIGFPESRDPQVGHGAAEQEGQLERAVQLRLQLDPRFGALFRNLPEIVGGDGTGGGHCGQRCSDRVHARFLVLLKAVPGGVLG